MMGGVDALDSIEIIHCGSALICETLEPHLQGFFLIGLNKESPHGLSSFMVNAAWAVN